MKINDVQKHLKHSKLDDYEIDVTRVVVHDEFCNHQQGDFRPRAVKRLLDMRVDFSADSNILLAMVKKMVSVSCPYDETIMDYQRMSGNSAGETMTYVCPFCKSEVSLNFDVNGIYVKPKNKALK